MATTDNKPTYRMIMQEIQDRIHRGKYPPQSFLPSENQLATEFGVTRTTIRRVLDSLKTQGTIESFQGKGYQVKSLYWEQSLLQFYSFGLSIANKLENANTQVLQLADLAGIRDVAQFGETKVWKITRLRLVEHIPLILETSYIPKEFLPKVDQTAVACNSLYDLLQENKVYIVKAKEYLEPVLPTPEASKHLQVGKDQPLFQVTRYTYDNGQRLVEVRVSLIRGDHFRFSVEMML